MDCARLKAVSTLQIVISSFLVVGIAIAYAPQHYSIVRMRSIEGISPWFLLLGGISSFCTLFNTIVDSIPIMRCIGQEGSKHVAHLAGLLQTFVQWLCFNLIIVLYVFVFPHHLKYKPAVIAEARTEHVPVPKTSASPEPRAADASEDVRKEWTEEWSNTVRMVALIMLFIAVSAILGLALHRHPAGSVWLMRVMGFLAIALNFVQTLPQIWHTYQSKRIGALSIPAMCMQTPGGVLFAIMLSRSESGKSWTSWVPYLVAAGLQGILLALCLYYRHNHRMGVPLHVPQDEGNDAAGPSLDLEKGTGNASHQMPPPQLPLSDVRAKRPRRRL